jgi:hypothetical protein
MQGGTTEELSGVRFIPLSPTSSCSDLRSWLKRKASFDRVERGNQTDVQNNYKRGGKVVKSRDTYKCSNGNQQKYGDEAQQ